MLDFDGVNLIKKLEKKEKFILKKVEKAKDSYEKMIIEVMALAKSKFKRIFKVQKDSSANDPLK